MIPIITFSYFGVLEIPKLDEILAVSKTDPDSFNLLCESYAVISHKHNKNHSSVNIHEILRLDMDLYAPAYILMKKWYHSLTKKYGYETVSKVIVPDQYGIQKKVENILNFVMDELYKTDELEIHFKVPGVFEPHSYIPEIIYFVLKSKFEITHEKLTDEMREEDGDIHLRGIQIKKRRN